MRSAASPSTRRPSSAPTSSKAARSSSTRRRSLGARSRKAREHRQRRGLASGRNAHLDPPRARADRKAVPARRRPVDAIETGRGRRHLEDLHEEEDAAEALGISKLLEVYAPIEADGEVVGRTRSTPTQPRSRASIADRRRLIWATTACVFALLWLALALSCEPPHRRSPARPRFSANARALADSYQRLEENALEAVETLQRDRRGQGSLHGRPLAARPADRGGRGRGARLHPEAARGTAIRRNVPRHREARHPDSILTKPAKLTPEEYERIKEHSAEGARIVQARPSARGGAHHPAPPRALGRAWLSDGLAGRKSLLAAAVVGLADAWDAMTTERPYHRALELDEAFAEVRNGRGTQFVPVVDAFFSVVRKRPGELGTRDGEAGAEARAAG